MTFSRKHPSGLRHLFLALAATSLALAQSGQVTSVSVGNYRRIVSPSSIVSGWGTSLAANTIVANTNTTGPAVTLPTMLGNVRLSLVDGAQATVVPSLYMVSPGQINYVLPDATAQGVGTLSVINGGTTSTGPVLVSNIAPAILTADGSGNGVPAAQILRVTSAGAATYEAPFQASASTFIPAPINLSRSSDSVYILLYGTGIRRHSLNPVIATLGDIQVPVTYAAAQPQYPGMDQVNIGPLPQTLAGKGLTQLTVTVDGVPANAVTVSFQ